MKKINWTKFVGNSSTEEALMLFTGGALTFKQFSRECIYPECKKIIKSLKAKGYIKARKGAKDAIRKHLNQNVYDIKDVCWFYIGPPSTSKNRK